jgi:fructosamine-3-kinase
VDIETLAERALHELTARSADLSLDGPSLRVQYTLNWGGFVNQSFHVSDGRRRLHLKLAIQEAERAGLERWRDVHAILEERYHAPAMLAWIAIPATTAAGPLFPHIDGVVPDPFSRALFDQSLAMLHRLHRDRELAARLHDSARTCAEVFFETYDERYRADLAFVEQDRPPFVDQARLAWMHEAVQALAHDVRASAAFHEPATAPTHGDIWAENFLVSSEDWFLLDWDDLSLGDPALDIAMLRAAAAGHWNASETPSRALATNDAVAERLDLYARAVVLDWTIDPLSDWIDATAAPEHVDIVRTRKQADHEGAYAAYRERYG